jgi:tetratricopeptide (TPR) repeat protein
MRFNPNEPSEEATSGFVALLGNALDEILRDEDPERFLQWMCSEVPRSYAYAFPPDSNPEAVSQLCFWMGRGLWDVTPLPGNDFRPRPFPKPERNSPCPCGSGLKFKRCCAGIADHLPLPDTEEIWPMIVNRLSPAQCQEAVGKRLIPPQALAELAAGLIDDGHARKAVKLLEPLFESQLQRADGRWSPALNTLCDAYEDLDETHKKVALLERMAQGAGKELRSEAWQRLATIYIDRGQSERAWSAFRESQRLTPHDPYLGVLEASLFIGEGRPEQAAERARAWSKRLEREGYEPDHPILTLLQDMARNPEGAFADITMESAAPGASALRELSEALKNRPLPVYALTGDTPLEVGSESSPRENLKERLLAMGIPSAGIEEQLDRLMTENQERISPPDNETAEETRAEGDEEEVLTPPAEIVALERDWHAVFPVGKPFSVHLQPFDKEDPWEQETFDAWLRFLRDHPAAFDSLDILDDLATALDLLGDPSLGALFTIEPLLRRALAIVEQAMAGHPSATLPWLFTENRPALRLIFRLTHVLEAKGEDDESLAIKERLMALNPNDNHGLRSEVMNARLRAGRDEAALTLAARYPDDILPEIAYGRVLALFRLGRLDEAASALRDCGERKSKVLDYLVRARVRKPKLHPDRVTLGGEDEAWFYREAMREVWLAVPGLMDWLKRTSR